MCEESFANGSTNIEACQECSDHDQVVFPTVLSSKQLLEFDVVHIQVLVVGMSMAVSSGEPYHLCSPLVMSASLHPP